MFQSFPGVYHVRMKWRHGGPTVNVDFGLKKKKRKCINVKEKCANMYVTVNPQNLKTLSCNIQNRHWSLFVKFSTTRFLVKYRLRADTRVTMGGDVPFCASGSGRLQINPFAHFLSNRTYHLHPHQQLCIFTNMCMVGVWLWLFILTDM